MRRLSNKQAMETAISKTQSSAAPVCGAAEQNALWRTHPQDYKHIAITFDRPDFTDGTGKIEQVIAALHALGGAATLNVAGESLVRGSPTRNSQIALLKEAIANGFEIGSYSWGNDSWATTKAELEARTYAQLEKAIVDTQTVVQHTLGVTPCFLRPPYLLNNALVADICRKNGLSLVMGNSSRAHAPAGYVTEEQRGATRDLLLGNAYHGAIWILHAHRPTTVCALLEALPVLHRRGYRFCTVSQLLAYNGVEREAGRAYAEIVPA